MSKRKGEGEEEAGPSRKVERKETAPHEKVFLPRVEEQQQQQQQQQYAIPEPLAGQMPSTSRLPTEQLPQYPTPHPPLRVKRPGRPRIHPPKPVGISKPRGRPRGSKNKKPRKRRDAGAKLVERPPKRPRGRPRKWPPEMWEGFQRSQFAAVSQQIQQQMQRQQPSPQEVAGPSHGYYEERLQRMPHGQEEMSAPPPLSHLPFHIVSQETPELPHLMHMPRQHQQLPQQQPLHMPSQQPPPHPMHPQQPEEQMLLLQPLYLQDPEQQQQPEQMLLPQEEHPYYQEQMPPHPPHTTS